MSHARVIASCLIVLAAAMTAGRALAAGPGLPERPPALMRLGVEPPTSAQAAPEPRRRKGARRDCRSLLQAARRLGETYAAMQLRRTVVARACAVENVDAMGDVWAWPWTAAALEGELPPRLLAEVGAWSIRCGAAGQRRRCALVHEGHASGIVGDQRISIPVVSHFIIDTIGGHERIVWRLYARRPSEPAPREAAARNGHVEIEADHGRIVERFDVCGRSGCTMEAELAIGERVASELIAGRSLPVTVVLPGEPGEFTGGLAAEGLREGLARLSTLRGRERGTIVGRRDPRP